jgi:flagellar biosynthetic protein FliS
MTTNKSQVARHYNQSNARGATPIGLVVAQFDQVIRDLRRAIASFDLGDVEGRTAHLNHALLVIAQLQNVLDHARGGQPARHFEQFYNATRAMLMEAQITAKREKFLECIELYSTVRQAWHQADQKTPSLTGSPAEEPHLLNRRSTSTIEPYAERTSHGNWNA